MRIDRIKFVSEMMKRDLTQCKLAEMSGVSRVTIGYIKAGKSCSEEACQGSWRRCNRNHRTVGPWGGVNVWKLCDVAQKGEKRMYIITATYQGKRIVRRAYSDLQVFTIVNQLYRDGCTDVGMREEEPD